MTALTATLPRSLALLAAVFLVVTGIAELAGAKNLGTAATFGQVAFALTLVALMLKGGPPAADAGPAADDAPPRG